MEQARIFLAIVLSFLVFLLWDVFFVKKQPVQPPQPGTETRQQADGETFKEETPIETVETPLPMPEPQIETLDARTVTVNTPIYKATFSEKGGAIVSFVLKDYHEGVGPDAALKEMLHPESGGTLLTTFRGKNAPDLRSAVFVADTPESEIDAASGPRKLTFSWMSPGGVVLEKTFVFSPASYIIEFSLTLKNQSGKTLQDDIALTLVNQLDKDGARYSFEGPSYLMDNNLEKVKTSKIEEEKSYEGKVSWTAIETHYFMSGIIPKSPEKAAVSLVASEENLIQNSYVFSSGAIQSGIQKSFRFDLFFGPKSLKVLTNLGNNLDKVVNFGMFDFLAKPCLWFMNFLHDYIPNYGVAIIIITIIIKIILWPLGNKSYKSMNEMKKLQPLMAEIREKYKNDKKRINEETMNLYKTYKINPMGGCLPMVVQIPVFLGFYRMLYDAIELRHAPFFGWINDLSAPDRLFRFDFSVPFMQPPYGIPVLTIIMGATMLLQQKMSPPPGDPSQAKMMMLMPIVFTVIFINFPAGLVVYWLVNNVLSIAQQYYIAKKNA